jgi:Glucose / Sorbosone dehydrogenase
MRRGAIVAGTVALATSAAAVVATIVARPRSGRILVEEAAFPAAMVGLPDGGLLYGERLTGRIRVVEPDGQLRPRPVAQVDVSDEGQRGLLGLAHAGPELYAAWTEPGGRIVVGRVAPGPPRMVWEGPPSARLANGGHLEVSLDGDLLIGIGDLLRPDLIDDPGAPNGKILSLDPDGPPDQEPRVVAGGWNNPFAFDAGPGGELWVADNEPGDDPERLVRVAPDGSPGPVTELPPDTAPAGLAVVNGSLVVCGFRSGLLLPYRVSGDRAVPAGDPLVEDCKVGVTVLADGEIAYARTDAILVVARG